MSRLTRFAALPLLASLFMASPGAVHAQRGAAPRHPPHADRAAVVRGHVFIGGYFYDPFFGPYPWWPRQTYPYWYVPVFDTRATLRLRVTPDEAAVYVDGFYAGIVEDFDGFFQGLPLTPGGHRIVLYLDGYRTVHHNLYLRPGSVFSLRETLHRLPPGEKSEPPELAPEPPPPPSGTYILPRTPPPVIQHPPSSPADSQPDDTGILDLYVQPAGAEVRLDGQRWVSSDAGHFLVRMAIGTHQVEISRPGYRPFTTTIEVRKDDTVPLNIVLMPMTSS